MTLNVGWMTLDTPDPAKLAPFWEQLLGWPRGDEDDHSVEFIAPEGGPRLLLWRGPDAKVVKNRMHLDLVPDDQEAEVARAIALGARRVDIGQGDQARHVVLADPEGNEFCILPAR
ncbi:MAG TPA: VOC family protein [Chloroflexota bacterium]|jgi:predicted enzyme related to lactoylglutathione lyase|nr:VOC family protein [Chloroflexota bacterium]